LFPPKTEPPAFLIVAGPNGSGKSSVYRDTDIEAGGRSIWIVNPDLLTARIQQVEGLLIEDANRAAVTRIEAWLEASIDVHKSIGVETVLSTGKYRRLVDRAKLMGFVVWLIYVVLDHPDRNVERVRLRVRKGGHSVDEGKIRARYVRSLAQLPWFLDQADRAWIYDNSGARPKKIGEKENSVISLDDAALPAIADAVATIRTD
jgi:predicted ABC-type ATPase